MIIAKEIKPFTDGVAARWRKSPPMSQGDQNAGVFSGIWTSHPDFTSTKILPIRYPPPSMRKNSIS